MTKEPSFWTPLVVLTCLLTLSLCLFQTILVFGIFGYFLLCSEIKTKLIKFYTKFQVKQVIFSI